MANPIIQRVQEVQQQANRLLLVGGIARAVACCLAAFFLVGLADYWIRFDDVGVRWIFWLACLALLALSYRKWLAPVLNRPGSLVHVAQRIEQQFPSLENRLSSAVCFLDEEEDDPLAGSPLLRRQVIAQATGSLEQINLQDCIDNSKTKRAVWRAAVVVAVVFVVCSMDVSSAILAARRMIAPWSSAEWPRKTDLLLVDPPAQLASGRDFEVVVRNVRGQIPSDAELQINYLGEATRSESRPLAATESDFLIRLESVAESFEVRVVGGDDFRMPWHSVTVMPANELFDIRVTVTPPEYSGLPKSEGGTFVRALADSELAIRGSSKKSIRQATLIYSRDEKDVTLPLNVDETSFHFAGPKVGATAAPGAQWVLAESGEYRLDVIDQDGLHTGLQQHFELRVLPDSAPVIAIQQPAPNTFVTPTAMVRVTGNARDDLKLANVILEYRRTGAETQDSVSIPIVERATPEDVDLREGDSFKIAYEWDLATVDDLVAGDELELVVRVSDFKQQTTSSSPIRITLISPEELQDRLAQQQADILNLLLESQKYQEQSQSQVQSLQIQLKGDGSLATADGNLLQSAELNQRNVARILAQGPENIEDRLVAILEISQLNKLGNDEFKQKLGTILATVRSLSRTAIPEAQASLLDAVATANRSAAQDLDTEELTALQKTLDSTLANQEMVSSGLQQLIDDLAEWDNYRRIGREVNRLLKEQTQLNKDVFAVQAKAIGEARRDLSTEEVTSIDRLSQRQLELARRTEKLLATMDEMSERLAASDAGASATLRQARRLAVESGIAEHMRLCESAISENRTAATRAEQEVIKTGLEELLDALANREENKPKRLLPKLKDAENELDALQGDLDTVQRQLQRLRKNASSPMTEEERRQLERLTKKQREIAKKIADVSRTLQRLSARDASESAQQAAQALERSAQAGGNRDLEKAEEDVAQAKKLLDEAKKQVQQRQKQIKKDLENEQMEQLKTRIQGLIQRQHAAGQETARLHQLQIEQSGQLSDAQDASLQQLKASQADIKLDTEDAKQLASQFKAFQLGLHSAAREMAGAITRLEKKQLDQGTQELQQSALTKLSLLVEAMAKDKAPDAGDEEKPPGAGGSQPPGSGGPSRLAELKLLLSMQQSINDATKTIEKERQATGDLTETQAKRLQALGQEQAELAELIESMTDAANL